MEQENIKYSIQRANEENISLLSQLFLESRGISISIEFLRKKYNTIYSGKTYFAHFALTPEGKPAAFFCLFPCFVSIDSKQLLAGQSADIITHVDHQKKGLFKLLGKATEELAFAEGMHILFAFPNENSFPGFVRSLQWYHAGNFHIYKFKANGFPIYNALHKLKLGKLYSPFSKQILRKSKIESSKFIGSIPRKSVNSGFRNTDFYQYKQYNNSFFIEIEDLQIWAKIDSILWIGDISINERISTEQVLAILKKLTNKLGLTDFIFEVSQGSYWDLKLSGIISPTIGVPIVYKNLTDVNQCLPLEFTGGDIDVF